MTDEKAVAHKDPIVNLLTQYKGAIKSVLPKHLTPERVLRIAYNAVQRTPKLRECTHTSLINSIIEVSKRGLEIGYTAHIIPYGKEAVFIADYKGFIDLAHRSGQINSFAFHPVYKNDEFRYRYGTDPHIAHVPCRDKDRDELVAAYAVVHFKHGGFDFEVIERADAEAIKKRSPGARTKDSPWNNEDEWTMWCKSAVRRLAKRVPQSPDLQAVAYLDEMAEAGMKQEFEDAIDAEFEEEKPSTEEIDEQLNNLAEGKGEVVEKLTKDPRAQVIEMVKDSFDADVIKKAKKELKFATGANSWPPSVTGVTKIFDLCQEIVER
ncbi:recombinase RecT [Candidatus Saccharibacteria bacterium]|nr:recombinase RecT [Candidatus Saccharibacteria bacterium]NIS52959.1 recombinase RecT [Phycisphaerae bacterium]NIV03936.1 recombinase RecT [Calditrichia bacterium]NIV72295.1 recombinase RecT [Calditrichia bacterium]NIV99279.1 recombinase RecT [Candidatus Saccharibacteria bacterium]